MASGNARPTRPADSFRNRAATAVPQRRETLAASARPAEEAAVGYRRPVGRQGRSRHLAVSNQRPSALVAGSAASFGCCLTPTGLMSTRWPLCYVRSTAAPISGKAGLSRTDRSIDASAVLSLLVRSGRECVCCSDAGAWLGWCGCVCGRCLWGFWLYMAFWCRYGWVPFTEDVRGGVG